MFNSHDNVTWLVTKAMFDTHSHMHTCRCFCCHRSLVFLTVKDWVFFLVLVLSVAGSSGWLLSFGAEVSAVVASFRNTSSAICVAVPSACAAASGLSMVSSVGGSGGGSVTTSVYSVAFTDGTFPHVGSKVGPQGLGAPSPVLLIPKEVSNGALSGRAQARFASRRSKTQTRKD